MRLLWSIVVVLSTVSVVLSTPDAGAETLGSQYRVVHVREEAPSRRPAQRLSDDVSRTTPRKERPNNRASRIHDLFPKDAHEKPGTKSKEDSLTVEPWVPGRGALGVRVEVTW